MKLKKIKNVLNVSSEKKDIAKISFGTLLGQVISFITLPILTRIYGAAAIGIWTLFNSISNMINSFSDLGLTNAIMIEEDEESVLKIYKVVSSTVLFIGIISGIIISIYYKFFPEESGLSYGFIGVFIIISVFTLQQIQTCYTWLNRKGKYSVLMKNPIINNISFGIIAIILGVFKVETYGYFISWLLGQIITLIHMKKHLPISTFTIDIQDYKYVYGKYINFIKYQLPTNITMILKNQIPILCIKTFFGTEMLGYYSITVRCLQIPISLLANSMGHVFFRTVTNMKRRGCEIGEYVYNNLSKIMKFAVLPVAILLLFGDYIIIIFLGEEWKIAGDFVRILAFQNFFTFITQTLQGLSIILNKQNVAMIYFLSQSVSYCISLMFGKFIFNSIYVGIFLLELSFIICNTVYFCSLFKVMNVSRKKYLLNVCFYTFLIIFIGEGIRILLMLIGIINSI